MSELALGVATGLAFGAVLTRGSVCFNSALRKAVFEGSPLLLRVFAIGVAVQLPVLAVLDLLGLDLTRIGLFPLAQLVGGIVFGVGMALAGGCIAGILWKTGAGSIATAIAIAGFAAGELLIRGPGSALVDDLDDAIEPPPETTLFDALGVSFPLLAIALGAVGLALLLRSSRAGAWAGLALGAVAAGAWLTGSLADYDYGLGFVGATEGTEQALSDGDLGAIPFPLYVAVGVVAGAALAGGRALRLPDGARASRALLGGLLMGVGGTFAHGCNIGNGLTGIPVLSLGSIWATAWMAVATLVAWRLLVAPHPRLRGTERVGPRRELARGEL